MRDIRGGRRRAPWRAPMPCEVVQLGELRS